MARKHPKTNPATIDKDSETLRQDLLTRIAELDQTQQSLKETQATLRSFQEKLKQLHEVGLELSQVKDEHEFFRYAIVLGRERLGFDRLGLFLTENRVMFAKFGTSPQGQVYDISDYQYTIEDDNPLMDLLKNHPGKRILLRENINEKGQVIGHGWNAITAIWDGDRAIGFLAADNLLKQEPYQPYIEELLLLYGATLGNIIRIRAKEAELRSSNEYLEKRVKKRTTQLEQANKDLEAFTFSVSHDLRAPLRTVSGYTHIILDDFAHTLDPEVKTYLEHVKEGALRMGQLIDDLLAFSRLGRHQIHKQTILPYELVQQVLEDLKEEQKDRHIALTIGELPECHADPALLRQVYANLVGNALKFTRGRHPARIEIGAERQNNKMHYFIRDNGAGFDMAYADKLFGVFQRLHRQDEFEGTGVGLAIVQRIIERHGGRIWAEAKPNEGATFRFTLA